ncbi:ring finger protein [Grosmannia clavigera kw1407]|uniref:Ring finger protein n=1 Tax=Grosmannia clavigera (strain kw1407 / UAMH 11150) TaxID=655863 RepID=F0XGU0_GROCL|nr:ring finger protein [Grosmannia clavigera kw1407]EFX02916.1 ring finger protein [Grosmannia clavigera kw1407]
MVLGSFLHNSSKRRSGGSDASREQRPVSSSSMKRPSAGRNGSRSRSRGRNRDRSHSRGRSQAKDGGSLLRPEVTTDAVGGSSAASSTTRTASAGAPEYISDEAHLAPLGSEAPDLRELNSSLAALAVVFPDVQVEVFREMLANFDGESRLALVADALLKNRVTWVKGRWRVAADVRTAATSASSTSSTSSASSAVSSSSAPPSFSPVAPAERFRSPEYKKAAMALAYHEFMGLSRSTINAVMAEQNYAYLDGRDALVRISGKSWRFALSSLFLRRKAVTSAEAENHPLIVWKSSGRGSILPTIRTTGSAELDCELFEALIVPLRAQRRAAQEDADRELASTVNMAEAEEAGATYDCACCFGTATFEEMTTCSGDAAHLVCFRCVQHSVREAVFGQGWARTIETDKGTLRCTAVDSTDCAGVIPADHLHRALLDGPRGGDVLCHLERRLAEHSLLGSGLPLVRCPFCAYAEVDDIYVPFHEASPRVRVDNLYSLVCLMLLCGATPVLVVPLLLVAVVAALLPRSGALAVLSRSYAGEQLTAAMTRYRRRRRGQQFRCQNPACGRVSCLGCSKEWVDVHVCHESSLVALRTQVEQAMSMAIKRVCPRCHTSFVKTVGCNKLTCPCGYRMCYVCRRDISGNDGPDAGYRHFCDHFRPHGDGRACNQCRKCNLWETEDTEAVLAAAREEAERKWMETERRELSQSERAFLETGIAAKTTPASAATRRLVGSVLGVEKGGAPGAGNGADKAEYGDGHVLPRSGVRLPSMAELLDWLLESVLV